MSDDIFTAGDLIVMSSGEYSSYRVSCLVKALKNFTLDDVKRNPECLCPKDQYKTEARISTAGLIAAGFVEELQPYREIWIGE